MELLYKDIIEKHKNEPALIMGHGPSLSSVIPNIPALKNAGIKLFSCNEWYLFFDTPVDYWVVANSEFTIDTKINEINNFPSSTLIYADAADVNFNKELTDKTLENNYLLYSDRDVVGRIPIYERLKQFTNMDMHYTTVGTVALHMLSHAILMGCNPIYVTGVDLDYSKGYALEKKAKNPYSFENNLEKILNSIRIIIQSANKKGISVFGLGDQPSHGGVFGQPISINQLIT